MGIDLKWLIMGILSELNRHNNDEGMNQNVN